MASKRRRANGSWEFTIKRSGLLPRAVSLTFDTEAEGDRTCARLEQMLDAGIVPPDLMRESREQFASLGAVIRGYMDAVVIKADDVAQLSSIVVEHGALPVAKLDYAWAEFWIATLKRERQLSPSTIRKYVGALARCCDWASNKGVAGLAHHPFRRLPRGYASYSAADGRAIGAAADDLPRDQERDRRLQPGEHERIVGVLSGQRPLGRQRPFNLAHGIASLDFYLLGLESCMRMSEMFTLLVGQVDFAGQCINLDRTKNGDKRQVPIMSDLMEAVLRRRSTAAGEDGRLFHFWDLGEDRRAASNRLSKHFSGAFCAAGCDDLRFHDLRHEATSRLFETTDLSDVEVSRITGHRDPRQLRRYSNLRPTSLVDKIRRARGR